MKKRKTFLGKYGVLILATVFAIFIGFLIIYLAFIGKGILPSGHNLEKKDWLAFIGSYISFSATFLLGLITILQTEYFSKKENDRIKNERIEEITPRFSISLNGVSYDKNSFSVKLINLGKCPITSIFIDNAFLCESFDIHEEKVICFSYSNENDKISILESDFEKDESGYSKEIQINYDDIEGRMWLQIFKLSEYEGKLYYSLDEREEI